MDANTIKQLIISVPALILAITIHEVSHGYVANRLGDPTARLLGRLTLNPIKHIDPVGTIIMPIALYYMSGGQFIFGYAKPVPINPSNFKNPKKGMAISAAAGPITNILLAIASSVLRMIIMLLLSMFPDSGIANAVLIPLTLMLGYSIFINIFLAALNLIPIPPLDGGRVLTGMLPYNMAITYSKIEPYGFIILIALIFTGAAKYFIYPVVSALYLLVPFI